MSRAGERRGRPALAAGARGRRVAGPAGSGQRPGRRGRHRGLGARRGPGRAEPPGVLDLRTMAGRPRRACGGRGSLRPDTSGPYGPRRPYGPRTGRAGRVSRCRAGCAVRSGRPRRRPVGSAPTWPRRPGSAAPLLYGPIVGLLGELFPWTSRVSPRTPSRRVSRTLARPPPDADRPVGMVGRADAVAPVAEPGGNRGGRFLPGAEAGGCRCSPEGLSVGEAYARGPCARHPDTARRGDGRSSGTGRRVVSRSSTPAPGRLGAGVGEGRPHRATGAVSGGRTPQPSAKWATRASPRPFSLASAAVRASGPPGPRPSSTTSMCRVPPAVQSRQATCRRRCAPRRW